MFKQLTARPAVSLAILLASMGAGTSVGTASAPPPALLDSASALASDWVATATLEPTGVRRGGVGHTPEIVELDLPTAGIATIEVATPRVDLNPIHLDVHRLDSLTGATILDQSATRIVLATRQGGSWWFRVAARETGRYKVVTSFTPARILDEHFELDAQTGIDPLRAQRTSYLAMPGQPPVKNQPEVIDPDPDTAGGDAERLLARVWRLSTSLPPRKNEPEVIDPDPDTATTFGIELDEVIRYRVPCSAADRADDHGDTASCATPIHFGERVTGTVDSWSNDDADVFSLRLDKVTTVEVHLADADADGGAVSTVVADLDDCAGRRLAPDLGAPATGLDDPPLVATLGPGRYCVRVEGDAASTGYALEVIARTP